MRKKIIFTLSIFAIMLFVMLIMPNKAMAITDITKVDITIPNVPRIGQNPSVTGISGMAYENNTKLSYGTISVTSAKWQAKSMSNPSYNDIADSHTYNNNGVSYKLVINVSVDGDYRLTTTTIAKANNYAALTSEKGDAEIISISSDGKTATITCTYYLIISHFSNSDKVGFRLTDSSGYNAFVLSGTNLELNASCSHNYIPLSPNYTEYFTHNTTTYLTKITNTKYSFVMPEKNIEIFTDHQREKTGNVRWGKSELLDLGTGYYKLRDDDKMLLTTNGATSSNYDIHFDEDKMILTLNDFTYSGTGYPLNLSSKQKYMMAIYAQSVDLTIRIKGNVGLNLSNPEKNYQIAPIYTNGGSLIIENAENADSELSIYDFINSYDWNYGILCDYSNGLTIRNRYPNEAKFKVNCEIRECQAYGFGIYSKGDISIYSVDLTILVEKINNPKHTALVPSAIFAENDVTLKNSVVNLSGFLSHVIHGDNVAIDGGEAQIRNYTDLYYRYSNSIYAYKNIFVSNQAKLKLYNNYKSYLNREISLGSYNGPCRILVEEVVNDPVPKEWDGKTPLSNYAYIEITPETPTGEDIYLNKGLKKIEITIDEPEIGKSFPETGEITSIIPNCNIDDLNLQWYWYYNTNGYPGNVISQVLNKEKGFEEGYYYVIMLFIPKKSGALFDTESLKIPGNITVNGKNVDLEGVDFDSYNPDNTSEIGLKINYCFGCLETEHTISIESYDITKNETFNDSYMCLTTDHGFGGWESSGYYKIASHNTNAEINVYTTNSEYEFVEWRAGSPTGATFTKHSYYTFNADRSLKLYAIFKEKSFDISLHSYNLTTGKLDVNWDEGGGGQTWLKTNYGTLPWTYTGCKSAAKENTQVEIDAFQYNAGGYEFIEWRLGSPTGPVYKVNYNPSTGTYTFTATEDLDLYAIFYGGLPFPDVNEGDWYAEAVEYAFVNSLISGYASGPKAGCFGPNDSITRAQIVTILWRQQGKPVSTYAMDFKDIKDSSAWYYEAIRWAAEHGIVTGYLSGTNAGKFKPDDNITREQLALILQRYAEYCGKDSTTQGDILGFPDKNKVSEWALEGMQWAVGKGIISGKGDGRLDPGGTATRAEAATMIMRFCKNILGL